MAANGAFPAQARFTPGSPPALRRLKQLNFDPIESLVQSYHRLEAEITVHEKIRDGELQLVTNSGRVRAYNAEAHLSIYNMLINIGDKLLRYHYGRVPETQIIENKNRQPLVVNLSGQSEAGIHVIGDLPEVPQEEPTYDEALHDPSNVEAQTA